MAESDESGRSRTSTPELNPLLNPLLNKNLGRWAEVYFKCPPDRRDEAVVQLLQELEREDSRSENGIRSGSDFATADASRTGSSRFNADNEPVVCSSCGFTARPNQKFCGRCGAKLSVPPSPAARVSETESHPDPQAVPPDSGMEEMPAWRPIEPVAASETTEIEPDFLSLQASRPFWHSYRFYVGIVLAVAIGLLGYLAWRGSQTTAQGIKLPEQAPATTSTPAAPTPVPQAITQTQPSPSPSEAVQRKSTASTPEGAEKASVPSATPVGEAKEPAPVAMEGVSRPPEAQPVSPHGSQELATAKEYLTGSGGAQADSRQAAEWLWKAVSKQNTEATVLLGRLYLRGDGVPKNCDQGRVLLDAAAKKGSKDAATMLQHLQAFECP